MIHFANPHPDELLYSVWARSAEQLRYPSSYTYLAEAAGSLHAQPRVDLPSHLDHFVSALPDPSQYSVEILIQEYTLYPFYRPFMLSARMDRVVEHMRQGMRWNLVLDMQLENSIIPLRGWFRYCPQCVVQDRSVYGETYWHRVHQISGVLVCPLHDEELVLCRFDNEALTIRRLIAADAVVQEWRPSPQLPQSTLNAAKQIAEEVLWVLTHSPSTIDLSERYRAVLHLRGLVKPGGGIRIAELMEQMETYYSPTLLQILGCAFNHQVPAYSSWLGRLLKRRVWCQHPLLHILTMRYLCGSVAAFYQPLPAKTTPLGDGPWPCLNPVCPDYHRLVIHDCHFTPPSRRYRPLVQFACACGFVYGRIVFGDQRDRDAFRKDRTLAYGTRWMQRFCEMWSDEGVPVSLICQQLGVSEMALHRHAEAVGLTLRMRPLSPQQAQQIAVDRRCWLTALAQESSEPRKAFYERYAMVRYRLRRYDRAWFDAHPLPPAPRGTFRRSARYALVAKGRVNWDERDATLATTIQKVAATIRAEDPPRRVSQGRLSTLIPEVVWMNRRVTEQYPQSRKLQAMLIETQEEFVLRKIRWLTQKCLTEHRWRGRQKFLEWAGVHRLMHMPAIVAAVNEAFQQLAPHFPDKRLTLFS